MRSLLLRCGLLFGCACPTVITAQARPALVAGRAEADWREDLRNPQPVVRQAAVEALAQFTELSSGTLSELLPLVSDPDANVQRTVIRSIGRGGAVARRAVPALWRAWQSDDALVAADAGIALLRLDAAAVAEFRNALKRADPLVQARAAAALANAGPAGRRAIHALRDRVGDPDPRVRGAALHALDALDATPGRTTATLVGRSLARELRDAPSLATDDAVARARTALSVLTRAGRDARGAIDPLQQVFWDGPAPFRTTVARLLGTLGRDGDRALMRGLAAGDQAVRDAAIDGLLIERQRRRALPMVLDTLRHANPSADTVRTRQLIEAMGYVAPRSRDLERALTRIAEREPVLRADIAIARRRLQIGY